MSAAASDDTVQLNTSISDTDTCIDFVSKDDLILDCKGFTISGDATGTTDYGIHIGSATGANNNTIRNCANISYFTHGIYIFLSNSNTITNTTTTSNTQNGIYISLGNNNNLTDITSSSNTKYGTFFSLNINNTLTNATLQENTEYDFYITLNTLDDCDHTFQNVTGSGGRPIEYYNYSVSIQDKTLSELILCGAGNSNITNVTVMGSDTLKNNMILLERTSNAVLSEINSSYNYYGIFITSGAGFDSNTLTDITVNNNIKDGIYIYLGNDNNLSNITASSNTEYGIHISRDSDNNTINDSRIENNTLAGIRLAQTSSFDPEYSLIYNNYLNNTQNLLIETSITEENYFNTTLDCSSGPNIIGGPCIGGNYWTDPDGNFSDLCVDSDGNGICDSEYNLTNADSVAYDYLPLSYTPVLIGLEYPADDLENTTDRTPDFIFNVSDVYYSSTYSCELFLNRTDSGDGTPTGYDINTSTQNDTTTTLTANNTLVNGYYDWWINCTNEYSQTNQSEVRNLSIQFSPTCSSCTECSDYIQNEMSSGDTLQLTSNISSSGTCIDFVSKDNLTLDCMGYTISGDGTGNGIYIGSGTGANNNTVRNCANISYFNAGIYILTSNNNTLTNITANSNTQYGIYLWNTNNNTLSEVTITTTGISVGFYANGD
ncbi:MAG: NosD domain-containing protein, partial [Candidatus Thorarchaeota archaeon]